MSLIAIKQHMQQVRMATLTSLCILFKAEPETVRCMLSHWIRKGRIRQCMKTVDCGSKCFKCPAVATELYEWIDESVPCF
jgi:putative ferrous iron transport protein C